MTEGDDRSEEGDMEAAILSACADALGDEAGGFDVRDATTLVNGPWLTVQIPIGRDLDVPVRAYRLLPDAGCADTAVQSGRRLAACIAAVWADAALIACSVIRVGIEAERLAAAMRAEGIELLLERTGVAPVYADRSPHRMPGVDLRFMHRGEDLRIATTAVEIADLDDLRCWLADWRPSLSATAVSHRLCASHGARAVIDPVAAAAARHFGMHGRDIHARVPTSVHDFLVTSDHAYGEGGVHFLWQDGVIYALFRLSRDVAWDRDRLLLSTSALPDTLIAAAPGRSLSAFVDHPALRGTTIARAISDDDGIVLTIANPGEMLLHPCGTVAVPRANEER